MATDPLCITPKTVVACKLSKVVIAIIYAVNENLFQPVLTLSAGSGTFVALRLVAAITIIVFGIVVETFLSFLLSCNIIQLYLMGLKYFIQRFIPQDSIGNIQFRTGQSGFKFVEGNVVISHKCNAHFIFEHPFNPLAEQTLRQK